MTPHQQQVLFVLVDPSHPGNIGGGARAIKTMGFGSLTIVAPRDPGYRQQPEAVARATGAADVLSASRSMPTLRDALAGVTTAYAMTGYDRQFGPPLVDLRTAAQAASEVVTNGGRIAWVFGTERAGLVNEDVNLCQACVAIPADPAFASLNLAQAVQVAAYECQLALRDSHQLQDAQRRFDVEPPATVDAVESFYDHLQQALLAIDFLRADEPKRLMPRLRRLFNRARPTPSELDLLRGICAAIIQPRSERKGQKSQSGH